MKVNKIQTETYILSELDRLDPVTVYVSSFGSGRGKIVIECFSKSWAYYWGSMGKQTLQKFFVSCDNDYILKNLLSDTMETDFDKICERASSKGFDICATNDAELAMCANDMVKCFGPDWYMDLPTCRTSEYDYVGRMVTAIRQAFKEEK